MSYNLKFEHASQHHLSGYFCDLEAKASLHLWQTLGHEFAASALNKLPGREDKKELLQDPN